MYHWIKGFFQNRTIRTSFNGSTSKQLSLEEGLPQGSALSCTLFLIFINDLPEYITCNKAMFADDLVIWTKGDQPKQSTTVLNRNLLTIATYCRLWKLEINTDKTVFSLFSLGTKTTEEDFELWLDGEKVSYEKHPKYLGVTLDKTLTLRHHVDDMVEKATSRLRLIKHLSSCSWGADQHLLRQLYIGYVRSVFDYSLPLQIIASDTQLSRLDRIQNQAVRFISGAMRTTPTDACEINTDIEPLTLRRERAVVEARERYLRMGANEENRIMTETWYQRDRIDKTSFLTKADDASLKHHLPPDRTQIPIISCKPPWQQAYFPLVKTQLLDPTMDKLTPIPILRTSTLETVFSYPEEAIHIFTDGSAVKATINAGFGAIIKYPNTHPEDYPRLFGPCGQFCSSYNAEIIALERALRKVIFDFDTNTIPPEDIVIFSDSKSALQALENGVSHAVSHISTLTEKLSRSYGVDTTFQWIPGHVGVAGNEQADRLAKLGSKTTQHPTEITYETCRQILKTNYRKEWLNKWKISNTGRRLFEHQKAPKLKDPMKLLKRKDQSLVFQLRTGHAPVNQHLNRINPILKPNCRHCQKQMETVDHILLHCSRLSASRSQYLPLNPTIANTLYTNTTQLQKTCTFVREAMGCQERTTHG
jgi:ribonuclease HI